MLLCRSLVSAAQPPDDDLNTPPTQLLRPLDVLENRLSETEGAPKTKGSDLTGAVARIQALEAGRGNAIQSDSDASVSVAASANGGIQAVTGASGGPGHDHDTPELSSTPKMSPRGFGDVRFAKEPYGNSRSCFTVGQLNLFITSPLTNRTRVLMGTVFESRRDSSIAVDVERISLQQRISRNLKLETGRNHTVIGHYNTAFLHGTWFQNVTAPRLIFSFEGGPLPIHPVGFLASGEIPAKTLALEYSATFGNGRHDEPGKEFVNSRLLTGSGRSMNVGFRALPDALSGLSVGRVNQATLTPANLAAMQLACTF
ncbi:MAG: hypothetical protein ABJF23_34105 [Bryobacteraceae bacterium]